MGVFKNGGEKQFVGILNREHGAGASNSEGFPWEIMGSKAFAHLAVY